MPSTSYASSVLSNEDNVSFFPFMFVIRRENQDSKGEPSLNRTRIPIENPILITRKWERNFNPGCARMQTHMVSNLSSCFLILDYYSRYVNPDCTRNLVHTAPNLSS